MLSNAFITAEIVFVVNLIGTAILLRKYVDGLILRDDCHKVSSLSTWLHLLINALSSLLMGASNLCMQLLAAPTRGEVDEAHPEVEMA